MSVWRKEEFALCSGSFKDLGGRAILLRRRECGPVDRLEEPVEIVRVRREDDRRRSVANRGRGDQCIDPVVGLGEVAQSSGATSGRLVGRLHKRFGDPALRSGSRA